MASIKIVDLYSQSFTSNLTDENLKKINGGSCTYAGLKYGAGSRVWQADGLYECIDIRFAPDRWSKI
ncbi:hypothetical protein H6G76_33910 [Nostoc sp. FACHB-152]|uniref:hypothetical protein n=1 Tax=unclassified Nostoc TaxID=2593658 RepID=UPI001685AFE7|nr:MULTISPECIES: hypothetical protein [unclassified Nostoc]MBD2452022.1 hypothetical protein [Nostoc sp. FACHB-152]MBD2473027.1 hypothetical protein [Nostoc sp. FACHB-145]